MSYSSYYTSLPKQQFWSALFINGLMAEIIEDRIRLHVADPDPARDKAGKIRRHPSACRRRRLATARSSGAYFQASSFFTVILV
jgi:hypothetical protein